MDEIEDLRPLARDCYTFAGDTHQPGTSMSISSVLKATAVTLALAAGAPVFAQGTPIDAAAFDSLVAGGTLVLEMSSTPNTDRGTGDDDKPFSVSTRE